jgi:predicted acylesterase/phospholipase RssA
MLSRFVCSFAKALNTPVRFRSYIIDGDSRPQRASSCTVWEAARATSAAATFFDPMIIGRQAYVDGATGLNNPVEAVLEEARSIWADALPRIQAIVSIGTGVPEPRDFGDDLKTIVQTLKTIATDTEQTHLRFLASHVDIGLAGRYFRFNVSKGMGEVRLDDHSKVPTIEVATEAYLGYPEVKSSAALLVESSVPNGGQCDVFRYNVL